MRTFRAGNQTTPELRALADSIVRAANRAEPFYLLEAMYVEPAKQIAGMIVYADGTSWNPGSGEGVYRRNLANTAWVFLG